MTSARRVMKRLTILGIFLFVCVLLGTFWYFMSRPATTCFDRVKNQNEQGVDCGGPCAQACAAVFHPEDIAVHEISFVPGGNPGIYDVLAKVYNPNDELGASELPYTFHLKDASGNIVGESSGEGFILPQEVKTFLAVNLVASATPVSADIVFHDAKWEQFSGYQEEPSLAVWNKQFGKISSGPFFFEASGIIENDSVFDFRSILVKVILRDTNGKAVAFNQTEMNTVRSKENREFRLTWPKAFPNDVVSIDVEPEADIYHSDNFIERYLPGGKFQELQ